MTNSEITGNGTQGIYIGANGNYPVASMPTGTGNNIYANNANGTQLEVSGYPGFVRADINWRDNFWGDGVFFWEGNPLCTGTSPYSPGHLAYRSSTGTVPAGPIDSGTYYVAPDPNTVYWCGWDRVKIDSCQFSSTYIVGDLREIDFAQPKDVNDALGCVQQADLTPMQLESDYSSVCPNLRTGYIVDDNETSSQIAANYAPSTQSLFVEFNAFQDVSCPYPGTALVSTMRVLSVDGGPDGIPITPFTCSVPPTPWWPSSGRIETGPSWTEPYASQHLRYIYQTFTWTQAAIDNIRSCDAVDNWTYEPDAVFDNYDGLHYFGRKVNFASTLPRKYNDTRWRDSDVEPTYTVGSGAALQLTVLPGFVRINVKYFVPARTATAGSSSVRSESARSEFVTAHIASILVRASLWYPLGKSRSPDRRLGRISLPAYRSRDLFGVFGPAQAKRL